MRFSGKSVVVTGAASGIGAAAAKLFAAEGARVLAVDLSAAIDTCFSAEPSIFGFRADVGVEAEVEAMIRTGVERFGRLDC